MAIAFACESCGHRFQLDDSFAGKKGKCKKCGNIFVIPSPARSSTPAGLKSFGDQAAASPKPRPAPPSRSVPELPVSSFDPYAIDDDPYAEDVSSYDARRATPPRSSSSFQDDEDFVPPRRAKPTANKSKKRRDTGCQNEGIPFFDGIPGMWYLCFLGVVLVLGLWTLIHPPTGGPVLICVMAVGFLGALLYGAIGMLVIPFQESVACGLMNMFVPIYPLYYLITRWGAMKGAFLSYLSGAGVIFLAILIPAVVAARDAANRAIARNNAAAEGVQVAVAPELRTNHEGPGPIVAPPILAPPFAPGSAPRFVPPALPKLPRGLRGRGINLPKMPNMPQPPANPEVIVTLKVKGLVNDDTRDLFNEKFNAMAKSFQPALNYRGTGGNGEMSYTIWPVNDVQAFADRFDFAKVDSVNGRTVNVVMSPAPSAGKRPADTAFVDQVLFDLKGVTANKRKDALRRLMSAPPDTARQTEVAKGVEPLLKDPDPWTRTDAAKALAVWGGNENTPALIDALKDPEFGVRWAVLDTIKALKDPAAAEAVTAMVIQNKDRHKAIDALKTMGPDAESSVLKLLADNDVFVRMEGCKILKEIGTEASVPSLQDLLRKTNGFGLDAMAARDTLQKMGAPERPTNVRKKAGSSRTR